MGLSTYAHTYRLRMEQDRLGEAREIEFRAPGPEVALRMVQQFCGERECELFEDGRPIATLRLAPASGYWTVGPA